MEQLMEAAAAFAAAVLTALAIVATRAIYTYGDTLTQRAQAAVQAQLGEAAGRIAAEIVAEVRADPAVQAASRRMIEAGANALAVRFADTVSRRQIPIDTLRGMVAGEVGKLGVGISR